MSWVALALALLSACGSQRVAEPAPPVAAARWTDDIIGEHWLLDAFVDADSNQVRVIPGSQPDVVFNADRTLSGDGGCNGYRGDWSVNATGAVQIGPLASTKKACGEPAGVVQQEQRLLAALQLAHSVQRQGDYLRIDYGTDGAYLWLWRIVREQAAPEPFDGVQWQLEHFEDVHGDAVEVTQVLPGTELTAWFSDDGRVRGRGGCNDWGASWWQAAPDILHLDDIVSTEMACGEPAGVMQQEQLFLQALAEMTQVSNDPDHLWLVSADGSKGLSFVRIADVAADVLVIRGGTSFGECLGYCWQEVSVVPEGATLTRRGWDEVAWPPRSLSQILETGQWQTLAALPDVMALNGLDDVIGCPDCADGGAEWIEIETSRGSRRVTFEYGTAPIELRELSGALESMRRDLQRRMDVATVIR